MCLTSLSTIQTSIIQGASIYLDKLHALEIYMYVLWEKLRMNM